MSLQIQTSCVNNPEFIELQDLLFRKFVVGGDYKFTVFNHAKDYQDCSNYNSLERDYKKEITNMCSKLNLECVDVIDTPWYRGNPSAGTASAMNFMLQNYHRKIPGKYFVIDSDMFLIGEMGADKYDEYAACYRTISRNEYRYMWNGIYYFDTTRMKNMDLLNWNQFKYTVDKPQAGCGYWTDTGGLTYKWIHQEEKNHRVRPIKCVISRTWDRESCPTGVPESLIQFCENDPRRFEDGKFYSELYEDVIFHYRAGGNWDNRPKQLHSDNKARLREAIMDILHLS